MPTCFGTAWHHIHHTLRLDEIPLGSHTSRQKFACTLQINIKGYGLVLEETHIVLWSQHCKRMLADFVYSRKYLDWRVGLVFLCSSRLSEDGTPVPKHVGVLICSTFLLYVMCFSSALKNEGHRRRPCSSCPPLYSENSGDKNALYIGVFVSAS